MLQSSEANMYTILERKAHVQVMINILTPHFSGIYIFLVLHIWSFTNDQFYSSLTLTLSVIIIEIVYVYLYLNISNLHNF